MNKNEIVLLDLLKKSLFNVDVSFPEDTDWDAVQKEAVSQTVVALAAAAVPVSESAKWGQLAAQSTAHYIRVLFEQTNLVNLFAENEIPFVIFKGMAAAVYYPNPQIRTMGDIDFIVAPERYNDTVELLKKNGYTQDDEHDTDRHYGFQKGGITFELHRRYSHDTFDVEPLVISGMKNAVVRTLNGYSFPTLPEYENGFIILEHLFNHMQHDAIGIRQIIDWAMFVNRVLTDETYHEHFLPLIESVGLVKFCENITKTCKMYLGLPDTFTWCDGADADTATDIINMVMQKGNFGVKELNKENKPMDWVAFVIKRDGFFKALQEMGVNNFEICQRNRFFRLFAWLFQLFRFARKGLSALFRGENLVKEANAGNQKADLHKRIGL